MIRNFWPIASVALLILASTARADTMFTLTDGGSCCGTGTFATVVLHVVDADTVQVTETLTTGDVWAISGAGESLGFNVDESFSFVVGSFSSGFGPGAAPAKASPFSDFSSGVDCTVSSICGSGTNKTFSGELQFEVTNAGGLTPSDFTNSSGDYFASDIGVPKGEGKFSTGNVAGDTSGTPSSVPEPASMFLLFTVAACCLWQFKRGLPFFPGTLACAPHTAINRDLKSEN
jgi:hypothetical protein